MKLWIKSNYHLVVLAVSLVLAIVSAIALISEHGSFLDKLHTRADINRPAVPNRNIVGSNIKQMMDRVDHPVAWNVRRDGASPLVSRLYLLKKGILVDPLEQSEPLYPPVPNKWLFDHGLDYTDVKILERDPKHKGFTVLEEFLAGTDPNNPASMPPLHTKLSYSEPDVRKSNYVLEFVGEEEIEGRKEFQLRPSEPLPNPANRDSKGNIKSDRNTRYVPLGANIPGIDFLKVASFTPKKQTINDTEYDVSELVLENSVTGTRHTIVKKNPSREYHRTPIEVIESVQLHYRLTGAPEEIISVNRGNGFTLTSLDKAHRETYKFQRISNEGILLEKNGVSHTIKPSQPVPSPEGGKPSADTPPNAP
jgi:hypothetical protein